MEENKIIEQIKQEKADLETELKVAKLKLADKDKEIEGYKKALAEVAREQDRYKLEVKYGIKKVAGGASEMDEKILRMIEAGKYYKEIAAELGVTYTTVYRHCHKLKELGLINSQK